MRKFLYRLFPGVVREWRKILLQWSKYTFLRERVSADCWQQLFVEFLIKPAELDRRYQAERKLSGDLARRWTR